MVDILIIYVKVCSFFTLITDVRILLIKTLIGVIVVVWM